MVCGHLFPSTHPPCPSTQHAQLPGNRTQRPHASHHAEHGSQRATHIEWTGTLGPGQLLVATAAGQHSQPLLAHAHNSLLDGRQPSCRAAAAGVDRYWGQELQSRVTQAPPLGVGLAGRRGAVCALAAGLLFGSAASTAAVGPEGPGIQIGGTRYSSIQDAIAAAQPGASITLPAGVYSERLVFSNDITIAAESGTQVEVNWQTSAPYQSTIQVNSGAKVTLRGLTIRHSSPSVANNYAVFSQSATLTLDRCDINSASGSGIAAEGGALLLNACTVHDCARTGLLATGDLDQQPADVCVVGCVLVGNRADGAVFLDGAVARFERCTVERNKGFGLRLKDSEVDVQDCTIRGNKAGSIQYMAATLLSPTDLQGTNSITPAPVLT